MIRGVLVLIGLLCLYFGVDGVIDWVVWYRRWGQQWWHENLEVFDDDDD